MRIPAKRYELFVSYRRLGGVDFARSLSIELKRRGYKTFFDYDSLRSGKFNEQIFEAIDQCKYFLLLLSDGSLERCSDANDWVRIEVLYALKQGKTIVPIAPSCCGRSFPRDMPKELEVLRQIQISILEIDDLFEKSVDKILEDRFSWMFRNGRTILIPTGVLFALFALFLALPFGLQVKLRGNSSAERQCSRLKEKEKELAIKIDSEQTLLEDLRTELETGTWWGRVNKMSHDDECRLRDRIERVDRRLFELKNQMRSVQEDLQVCTKGDFDENIKAKVAEIEKQCAGLPCSLKARNVYQVLKEKLLPLDPNNKTILKALKKYGELVCPVLVVNAELEGSSRGVKCYRDGVEVQLPYRHTFNERRWVEFDNITAVAFRHGQSYSAKIVQLAPKWNGVTNITLRLERDPDPGTLVDVAISSNETIRMVWCPPTQFSASCRGINGLPDRVVKKSVCAGFWIAQTELTWRQYRAIKVRDEFGKVSLDPDNKDLPITMSMIRFSSTCMPVYQKFFNDNMIFRIPTISEWLSAVLYKDGVPCSTSFQGVAWNRENATSEQLPQKLKPNALGLYDCFGNVREWALGNAYAWFGYREPEEGDSNRVVALGGCWRDDYDDSINWLRKSEPAFSGGGGDVAGIRLLGISCDTCECDFVARHKCRQ